MEEEIEQQDKRRNHEREVKTLTVDRQNEERWISNHLH